MAAAILIESIATATMSGGAIGGEVELVLADGGVEIPAVFSIDIASGETDIPMCGITPYGRMTFQVVDSAVDGDISVVVTASPKDGSSDVTATTTLADLLDKVVTEGLGT